MLAALWLIAMTQAAPVFSVEPTTDGIRLVTQAGGLPVELASLKIGPVADLLRHGDALYAALAAGGVAVVNVRIPAEPRVVGTLAEGRLVQRLAHQGPDVLVLVFADRSAEGFSLADPLAPVPTTLATQSAAPPLAPEAHGTVLGVRDGTVVIQGGSSAGFREGEHVAILSPQALDSSAAVAEAAGLKPRPSRTAVIALDRVELDKSLGHLGRGDRAEVGDAVESTAADLTGSTFLPPANTFSWRLSATLRTAFNTNQSEDAAGLLLDLMVAYSFHDAPVRLEAGAQPLGFAAGASETHNPLVALADVAYSAPFFEVGIGGGMGLLASSCTGGSGATGSTCPVNSALPAARQVTQAVQSPLLVETLRLGPLDGANVAWVGAAGVVPGQGFQLFSGRAEVNVPIAARVTLFGGGGGGVGYFYGETGARVYLNGVGGPGTVILSGALGGAGIQDNAPEVLAGPALSLGAELRL